MWRQAIVTAVLGGVSIGCGFDPSGQGTGSGAPVPAGEDDDGVTASSDGDSTASGGPGSGEGDATSSTGGGDDADSSGGDDQGMPTTTGPMVDPCDNPAPFTIELTADQASLVAPMQLGNIAAEGSYAYSEVADAGRASFEFQVPCEDEFRAYARVYDPGVGIDAGTLDDPDSYEVAFDGDGPREWLYGCQTFDDGIAGHIWTWVPIVGHLGCFVEEPFTRTLSPGVHLLHLDNRESGNHQPGGGSGIGNVAAISRVVITSDPAYAP